MELIALKKILILFIVALIAVGGFDKLHSSDARQITPVEEKQLKDYQKQIDRESELKKMQNPTIVRSELKRIGKIIALEGRYKYYSIITNKALFNKLTLREITLDFEYAFQIGIDLQYINISKIKDGNVYISIPKNRIQLQSVTMNNQDSKIIDGNKLFLVNQFSPSDVGTLVNQSQQNCVNKIGADKELFNKAYINVQDELEKLVKSLGYKQVIYIEERV